MQHYLNVQTSLTTCRLASGDNEGRVVVWDVSSGTVIASLEDPLSAAQSPGPVARKTETGKGGAVRGLAWIMSNPCVLGIVMTSGMFLVWDMQGMLRTVLLWMMHGDIPTSTRVRHLYTWAAHVPLQVEWDSACIFYLHTYRQWSRFS